MTSTRPTCSRLTRRGFLRDGGAATAALLGALTAGRPRLLIAGAPGPRRLLTVILRGALDGLAAVPPYADPHYARLRGELAIAPPGTTGGALPLDGQFGLHPSLQFLHERYAVGEMLVFHAVASPYRERSHFDGQAVLENGLIHPLGSADGWLNRLLGQLPAAGLAADRGRAVAIAQNLPLILRGEQPVLTKASGATADVDEELMSRLADLYSQDDWFSARLSEAAQTQKMTVDAGPIGVGHDRLSTSAAMAGALMKVEGGPQIAVLEATGWDTHANQGAATGNLAQRLSALDGALRTYAEQMQAYWSRTVVLVITEFGRTAAVNGTHGTDHGTGGCAFLIGGPVRGGRVVADWPGLSAQSLWEQRDLRPTLDLRSVFKGLLAEQFGLGSSALATRVFPDSSAVRATMGLINA